MKKFFEKCADISIDFLEFIFYPWKRSSRKRPIDWIKRYKNEFNMDFNKYPPLKKLASRHEEAKSESRVLSLIFIKLYSYILYLPAAIYTLRRRKRIKSDDSRLTDYRTANVFERKLMLFGYKLDRDDKTEKPPVRSMPLHKKDVYTGKRREITEELVINSSAAAYLKPGDSLVLRREKSEKPLVVLTKGRAKVCYMNEEDSEMFSRALSIGAGMYAVVTRNCVVCGERCIEFDLWVKNRAKRE